MAKNKPDALNRAIVKTLMPEDLPEALRRVGASLVNAMPPELVNNLRAELEADRSAEQTEATKPPQVYYYSDLARFSKLQRSALTNYIKLAGLPKTKRGQRDRTFSGEDTKAFLFAVKRNCRINKHREAAAESLEKLP